MATNLGEMIDPSDANPPEEDTMLWQEDSTQLDKGSNPGVVSV